MAADRAFGRVERILRKFPEVTSVEQYVDLYSQVGSVKILGQDWQLYNVKELEKNYKKVSGISDCKRISIQKVVNGKDSKIKVATYQFYRFLFNNNKLESLTKKK